MAAKTPQKEMANFFFQNYDMVKCRRNVNFEEMDTERSTRKNEGF